MKFKEFDKPEYFVNRELSWIKFDDRVLSEARDKNLPLFERLKFLSITSSNLDEFYMVRVASLKDQVHAGYKKTDIAGMTAKEQLKAISRQTHDLVHVQYSTLNRSLVPALEKAGLHVIFEHEAFSEKQKEFVDQYFEDNVYPVLTPMAMDSSRPFPLIRNKTLNIGALLSKKDTKKGKEEIDFATVQVPSVLPRVVIIPSEKKGHTTVTLLEQIIERNIDKLFLSYDVICAHPYRIMRNADLPIDEDEAEDLLVEIQKQLKKRQWGEVIRLEVEDKMDPRLLDILKMEFQVHGDDIFFINGPLDLTMLMKVYGIDGYEQFKEPKYKPAAVPAFQNDKDIFQVIREGDVFLHHPYMSFDPVVNFVRQAAKDQDVLAIKQTLYRVSGNSPIIAALAQAAENGKQVSVLVELKARFDEENNIVWAKMLEKAGCHVIYGLVGLKTHSKITLVVRREENGIRRYVHLATGNYNDSTAKLYTDCGIFTCDERFGEDATAVFNMLSGYSEPKRWNRLIVAPIWMKDRFVKMIEREAEHAKKGEEVHIGWSGMHVTNRKKGEEVHVGWDGVHVEQPNASGTTDNPKSVHVDSSGVIIGEQHFENWREAHKAYKRKPERAWRSFPFPLVILVAYVLLGLFANAWVPGLMLAFAVPAYYVIGNAWEKRRLSRLIGGLYPIGTIAGSVGWRSRSIKHILHGSCF